MPKIEKDLLKVKGTDGQWRYVPAVGGSADTSPTWDSVQNKPFSTLGGAVGGRERRAVRAGAVAAHYIDMLLMVYLQLRSTRIPQSIYRAIPTPAREMSIYTYM